MDFLDLQILVEVVVVLEVTIHQPLVAMVDLAS